MRGRADPVICKINGGRAQPNPRTNHMILLERNGDRTDPWAFGWPVLKIGLRALLWPDWKRYSVLRTGCTDSRLSQAFCASARPEEAIQNATPVAAELQQMRKRN